MTWIEYSEEIISNDNNMSNINYMIYSKSSSFTSRIPNWNVRFQIESTAGRRVWCLLWGCEIVREACDDTGAGPPEAPETRRSGEAAPGPRLVTVLRLDTSGVTQIDTGWPETRREYQVIFRVAPSSIKVKNREQSLISDTRLQVLHPFWT